MKRSLWLMLVLVSVLVLGSGCATRGRFSAIDADLRSPQQIEAYRFEAAVPYMSDVVKTNAPAVASAQVAMPPSFWIEMIDALKLLKCRIRILSVEWTYEE